MHWSTYRRVYGHLITRHFITRQLISWTHLITGQLRTRQIITEMTVATVPIDRIKSMLVHKWQTKKLLEQILKIKPVKSRPTIRPPRCQNKKGAQLHGDTLKHGWQSTVNSVSHVRFQFLVPLWNRRLCISNFLFAMVEKRIQEQRK